MAGLGMGIGAFMDGFTSMDRAVGANEDRAYRRQKDAQERDDYLFERQHRLSREAANDKILAEERARQHGQQDATNKFTEEVRDQQRQSWQRDDALRSDFKQSVDDANAARGAEIAKSIEPIEAQGPTQDGRGLPAWKVGRQTFTDQTEAQGAAEKQAPSFMDYWMKNGAPKMQQSFMAAGQPEKAQAFGKWVQDTRVQTGLGYWAKATQAAAIGDADAFADNITKAYNANGYFEDGSQASATVRRDKSGNADGMDLVVTDAKGRQTKHSYSMQDAYKLGVQFLSPENTFKTAWDAINSEQAVQQKVEAATAKATVPPGVQKAEDEDLEAIQTANSINSELGHVDGQIQSGKLSLGPVSNLISRAQNYAGASSENSRNFSSLQSTLEKLRNDSLRLNKGVQTEGDAQRAWNELISNVNDPEIVRQRIAEISRLNTRAAEFKKRQIQQRRSNNNLKPMDVDNVVSGPPSQAAGQLAPSSAPPQQPSTGPDVGAARRAPDGNWYVPDPARPGKFLQVVRP